MQNILFNDYENSYLHKIVKIWGFYLANQRRI